MATETPLFKIGITQGDINGIGYEVIMKSLSDLKMMELCTPIVYGLAKIAAYHKKSMDIGDFSFQFIKTPEQASAKKANLINLMDGEIKIEIGTSTEMAGKLSALALNSACKDLKANLLDAIVTAPINKNNIQSEKFKFPGHTEYLAHQFQSQNALMLMVAEELRIGFVTNHLPIHEVAENISIDLILKKLRTLHQSLVNDFACTNPKIAVLSLNPHAGDHNLIGKEENTIIIPAIQQAFDEKINAFGPFPSDGFFASGEYKKFDAILAMYHDQGMIPFKVLAMDQGVNFTAGLPIVRTSPAHGTAYEIAGKNQASCQSFRNAIYLAIDILRNREIMKQ
ncbi:MAG: 4-hydroxythreonine-4-phosphate dehydrogenase PdxA [Bacteroidales bacterium]